MIKRIAEKVKALTAFFSSFANVGCMRYIVVLDKNLSKRMGLNVGLAQVVKLTQQKSVMAWNYMVNLLKLRRNFILVTH